MDGRREGEDSYRKDDIVFHNSVDRQTVLVGLPREAAADGEPANAGADDSASDDAESKRNQDVIYILPYLNSTSQYVFFIFPP